MIETTSPLYLRRLVRAINDAPAAYVDGDLVGRNHNPRRSARASFCRADNAVRFFAGSHPTEMFTIRAAEAARAFCDHVGETIVATRKAKP